MARAFNEWMRRYVEEPARFEREWKTVGAFIGQDHPGSEPDYGASCSAYLAQIMEELDA